MDNDIYVIVSENDQPFTVGGRTSYDDGGPLVWEQYTRTADLESIKKRVEYLGPRHGKCRIAKLIFLDEAQEEKLTFNGSAKERI